MHWEIIQILTESLYLLSRCLAVQICKFNESSSSFPVIIHVPVYKKGKSVPLQARGAQRVPDYVTAAQDDGKVVSLTHRSLITPRKYYWY